MPKISEDLRTELLSDLDQVATVLEELETAIVAADTVVEDPPSGTPTALPTAPTGLQLVRVDNQLVAIWDANPAGEFVTSYQVYLDGQLDYPYDGFTDVGLSRSFVVPGESGTTHRIRVGAKNAFATNGGYGPWGPQATGTIPAPQAPPEPPEENPPPPSTGLSVEDAPYRADHPIYVPVPANPALHPDSVAIVNAYPRNLGLDAGTESPAIYRGVATDPTWTLTIEGSTFTVKAPSGITPGGGNYFSGSAGDHPLVIFDTVAKKSYRMWRAVVNATAKTVSCQGGGVGSYDRIPVALGQAEIHGQNTGSGCCYTVGMIRPAEIAAGRIVHALRIASGWLRSSAVPGSYVWPALRTETSSAVGNSTSRLPMGARLALSKAFYDANKAALEAEIDRYLGLSGGDNGDALNKRAAKIILAAMVEYGMCALDGSSGSPIYCEGDNTAGWPAVMGKKNSSGSYNHIARALDSALSLTIGGVTEAGWKAMRVLDPAIFNGYGR